MNVKTYGMDAVAGSYVGSKLYELFAKTPFEIVERMPHASLPDGVTLGYDVKIDEKTDFAVRNTQASIYRVVATQNGSDVTLELRGTPFKETVTTVLEGEKTIPFRTITRYSATLTAGTTSDTQAGEEGKSIEVYRVTKTTQGEKKQLLSLDFYSAIPAIVTKSSQEEQAPVVVPEPKRTRTPMIRRTRMIQTTQQIQMRQTIKRRMNLRQMESRHRIHQRLRQVRRHPIHLIVTKRVILLHLLKVKQQGNLSDKKEEKRWTGRRLQLNSVSSSV
ncbi:G5 domain-containing protein [Exiguobacterium sp. SL14]|nr:G5 domain-containing protein [Exiguobacterium sp. SL14]MCY1690406.1 G5 domain-containing protein [Exiguobacterium sp. SL14]